MSSRHARAKSLTLDFLSHDEGMDEVEKEKEIGKSYSFISRTSEKTTNNHRYNSSLGSINEEDESDEVESDQQVNLDQLSHDVDKIIDSLSSDSNNVKEIEAEVSAKVIEYLKKLEIMIDVYESGENSLTFGQNPKKDSDLIESINRVSALHRSLNGSSRSNHATMQLLNETSVVLHQSMVFLEEELRLLLDEPMDQNSNSSNSKHWDTSLKTLKERFQSFAAHPEMGTGGGGGGDSNAEIGDDGNESIHFPSFTPQSLCNIGLISNAMISGGHEVECCNIFAIARRHAFEEELKKLGFDKMSIDDTQKMNWEALEGEIVTWIKVFKHCFSDLIPCEQQFYELILPNNPAICQSLLGDLACGVFSILLNFAEAVAMAKRSTEKLFKFLDVYETIRDSIPLVEDNKIGHPKQCVEDLRAKLSFAQMMLGEAAVSIFCQLENSIKADSNKTPVPNGAVHPLTRYTMNYLKYACEYKDSLEEVFQRHLKIEQEDEKHNLMLHHARREKKPNRKLGSTAGQEDDDEKKSPYASQLLRIMDLLDQYLDAKSKLYKDPSLRYIFLMNNGRYILQKVRGSAEISQVVGDNWIRRRSSDVRNHHKNYQRETWTKVLQCLNHEGLQLHGKVYKPYLKERFKNFNQLFDEIHRTQSTWVVSDEQLQSELRVSISAVIIPAYRSFVARFGQIFTPGRQVEKYIKFQPEDVEAAIEDLFDGNTTSMAKRRNLIQNVLSV
ncbi:hypothetical protein Cgig2_000091 [Carnegiea gigantea]|uniref:Exocyst subunit Exo70 family protein n=1 Tax=Carnegiea gigantea TaxID=171969 RepID=A0A9Q1QS51_9CARY|nr:hypothetical protein Cgig2_000091 [Carnegiea gigantea]